MEPNTQEILKQTEIVLTQVLEQKRVNEATAASLGPAIIEALRTVIETALKAITVTVPALEQPVVHVTVPEIKIPDVKIPPIKVPKPEVTVKLPPNAVMNKKLDAITAAILNQPTVNPSSLHDDVNFSRPLAVILTDHTGKPYKADEGGSGSAMIPPKSGLYLREYDYVSLTQSDNKDVYTFKKNGSSGSAIGSITIVYVDATRATISTVTRG